MGKMLPKPSKCIPCSLYQNGTGFCPDADQKEPEIVMVAEAPGKNEINWEPPAPMVGSAGFVLKEWGFKAVPGLALLMEQGKITIANMLRCLPPETQGRAYPRGKDKLIAERVCRTYDRWPSQPSVKTVVLLGEAAQRYHFGYELEAEDCLDRAGGREVKGVLGRIGRIYERDSKRWVFAPHPAWVLRQPMLVQHLQAALKIAIGREPYTTVRNAEWEEI